MGESALFLVVAIVGSGFAFFLMMGALLMGISVFNSLISGWFGAARRFPAKGKPVGEEHFVWGCFGTWSSTVPLTFYVSPEGLRIHMFILLRAGHAPIFVPWQELGVPRRRTTSFVVPIGTAKLVVPIDFVQRAIIPSLPREANSSYR